MSAMLATTRRRTSDLTVAGCADTVISGRFIGSSKRGSIVPDAHRTFPSRGPLDLRRTLAPCRVGRATDDPPRGGRARRASRTPAGPATVALTHDGESVGAEAWGPGADWARRRPALLGSTPTRAYPVGPSARRAAHPPLPGVGSAQLARSRRARARDPRAEGTRGRATRLARVIRAYGEDAPDHPSGVSPPARPIGPCRAPATSTTRSVSSDDGRSDPAVTSRAAGSRGSRPATRRGYRD